MLKILLQNSGTNFYSIIYDIVSCKAGKRFKIDAKNQTASFISPLNSNIIMDIPLPFEIGAESDERIDSYMRENGIGSYTLINRD